MGVAAARQAAADPRGIRHAAARQAASTQYKAGYLPYSIIDGWQQIRKDFAYWRADVKGAETAATPEERAWFEADRRLREKLTLARHRHLEPLRRRRLAAACTSRVHFNGWGELRQSRRLQRRRTSTPISRASSCENNIVRAAGGGRASGPARPCNCSIEEATRKLLLGDPRPGRPALRAGEGRRASSPATGAASPSPRRGSPLGAHRACAT